MKRITRTFILLCLLCAPARVYAQGGAVFIGYGFTKFQYRPANLDIVRYKLDQRGNTNMEFPDYLRGMSFGIKQLFGENGSGEYRFSSRKLSAEAIYTDSLGNASTYGLRCRMSSLSVGGSAGIKYAQLGFSFDISTFYIASRVNNGDWEATFSKKRKLWFGHTLYASFMLPVGDVVSFEVRPYWQTSWFSVRMGSDFPLIAFRPSNFGVMLALGLNFNQE